MSVMQRDLSDMARYAPPYSYAVAVAVNATDQTFAGYKIVALQSTTAGAVTVDTADATGAVIYLPAGVPMQVAVTKVYHTGTAAGIQSGCITALGFAV